MEPNPLLKGLDDWAVVRQFLPLGWEEAAQARRIAASTKHYATRMFCCGFLWFTLWMDVL